MKTIEDKTAKMTLSRTRRNQIYMPHSRKEPYFDAISGGDADAIDALAEKNRDYISAVASKCASEDELIERMRSESAGAVNEMCLVSVQSGLLDMVAYDIRDGAAERLKSVQSAGECYDLVHEAAREYALRMSYLIKEKKYSPRLIRMMEYIREHIGEKIELADIARHVNISRTYASAVFKDELGINISGFILKERLSKAKTLLRETDMSVAEISETLAFCSQSYFTKLFREAEGMTPLEYRKRSD